MSTLKTAVIVLLVVVLAVDLAAANAVVAAERTVLDADYVTTALEEEGAYEELQAVVVEGLPLEDAMGEDAPPLPIDTTSVVESALTPSYIQSQTEPNVEQTYAYIHGNADTLGLVVDLEPAKTAVADAVEAELTDASAAELVAMMGGESGDLEFQVAGQSRSLATMAAMAEEESRYDAERAALREALRSRVLERLVDEAYAEATNDERLALVIEDYDPNDYSESEKEQLVAENEADIRAAIAERIEAERGDEIDAAVEDELDETRSTIREEVSGAVEAELSGVDGAVADAALDLVLVGVDGLVTDMTHDEYRTQFEAAADDLALAATDQLTAQLDAEVPDEYDLASELGPEAEQQLADARQAVGLLDLLAVVLPLVGLGLVGAVFLVSRSIAATAIGAGVGLVLGGLPALVGASQLTGRIEDAMAGGELPPGLVDLAVGLVGRVADAVVAQSALVVVLGVGLLAIGLALKFEVIGEAGTPSES